MGPGILTAVGVVTWLFVAIPAGARAMTGAWWSFPRELLWWTSYVAFGAGYLGAVTAPLGRRPLVLRGLLALQTVAGLCVAWLGPADVVAILLVVVAAEAATAVSLRIGVGWVTLQTAALGVIAWRGGENQLSLPIAAGFGVFQGFAYVAARLTHVEAEGRRELARVNAELLAAQALLTRSTRLLERQRISRDLHDGMGHHLTALSLHLEALRVGTGATVPASLERAQGLTRQLLGDLRETVGDLRREDPLPLRQALDALARGLTGLDVHVTYHANDLAPEPQKAHALFRCTQELVTNVLKHARARQLWLTVEEDVHTIRVEVRDDGVGTDPSRLARGLVGIRERLAACRGAVVFDTAPGCGCTVAVHVPRDTPA